MLYFCYTFNTPDKRFNVAQVPLPFAIDRKINYEESVSKEERKDH